MDRIPPPKRLFCGATTFSLTPRIDCRKTVPWLGCVSPSGECRLNNKIKASVGGCCADLIRPCSQFSFDLCRCESVTKSRTACSGADQEFQEGVTMCSTVRKLEPYKPKARARNCQNVSLSSTSRFCALFTRPPNKK